MKWIRLGILILACPIWIGIGYSMALFLFTISIGMLPMCLFNCLAEDIDNRDRVKSDTKDCLLFLGLSLILPFVWACGYFKTGEI